MKILSVSLQNFASYESLEFDFQNQGLTLINGPTGSGKSTLCDAIPWVLFGRTAKDGAVDEVLSWPGDLITWGNVAVDDLVIVRQRGSKAKDNDLYVVHKGGSITRGKDIPDTQRLIEQRLGVSATTYLAGAYYHEFSQTAQFFTATAKNRRQLTEQLVDLSLAKKLQEKTAERVKGLNKDRNTLVSELQRNIDRRTTLAERLVRAETSEKSWAGEQEIKITRTQAASKRYKTDKEAKLKELTVQYHAEQARKDADNKARLQEIKDCEDEKTDQTTTEEGIAELQKLKLTLGDQKCSECGAVKDHQQHTDIDKDINSLLAALAHNKLMDKNISKIRGYIAASEAEKNPYRQQIKDLTQQENPYLQRLKELKAEVNPHLDAMNDINHQLTSIEETLDLTQYNLDHTNQQIADLELLSDIIADFRSQLVKGTIVGLETQTNKLLEDHFDAEIRVAFTAEDADKLDVQITKDGNQCVFTQLSKGQRQLLKLSFGVAVMRQVSNHNGIAPNVVFFDEALDSLDEVMRAKCFRLLESLVSDYESVFVVDHSESFKALFNSKYNVQLLNGNSIITKE